LKTHRNRETILDGHALLEGARWRSGSLYVSDLFLHQILRIDPDSGRTTIVSELDDDPSGLGWLPDGTLVAVSVERRHLLAVGDDGTYRVAADLSNHTEFAINDMTIDSAGHAFIGQVGFDRHAGPLQDVGSPLFRVDLDGSVHVAAEDLHVANGMVVTSDQATLVVAESLGHRLTAFDLAPDGALSNRRIWAQLDTIPDGLCLDSSGAIWVALPHLNVFRRVAEGGAVLEEIAVGDHAVDSALGGDDGRTLFMLCTSSFERDQAMADRKARIDITTVDVPG
jgi:sugar lactone lactonase YvrE